MKQGSTLERSHLKRIVEALLFTAGRALGVKELTRLCHGAPVELIKEVIQELMREYEGRGVVIREVANGFRVETAEDLSPYVKELLQPKSQRLSRPLLETLAMVAYYQPITRAEVSARRGGVDAGPALRTLLERGLIRVVGRKPVPGRPPLYGTTAFFLEYFGLKSLEELPPLEELKRLSGLEEKI